MSQPEIVVLIPPAGHAPSRPSIVELHAVDGGGIKTISRAYNVNVVHRSRKQALRAPYAAWFLVPHAR